MTVRQLNEMDCFAFSRFQRQGNCAPQACNGKPGSVGYERFFFVNQDGGKSRIPADYSSSNKVQGWEIGYDPVHHTEWYYIGTHVQL